MNVIVDTTLPALKAVFTFLLGIMSNVLTVIVANPILMIGLASGLIGTAIGVFHKLRH